MRRTCNNNYVFLEFTSMKDEILDQVRELKSGSCEAFTVLYFKYSKRLYAFAMSYLKNEVEVEEIVQDVFLSIWKNRTELKEDCSFDSYVFTIAKNAILNTLRSKKYKISYLNYKEAYPSKYILLEEELNFHELEKIYLSVVDTLSPRKREVFILNRVNLLSYKEVATKLGISVKTVENHMSSALAEIRLKISSLGCYGLLLVTFFL